MEPVNLLGWSTIASSDNIHAEIPRVWLVCRPSVQSLFAEPHLATNFRWLLWWEQRAAVKIFLGDQEDVSFLREVSAVIERESGGLEFVIDDGGHTMSQQMTAFTHLMPLVKPGGTYFMEDLETSYYEKTKWGCYGQECGGGPPGKAGTTVAFFKSLIDVLNEDFQGGPNKKSEWGIGNYSVNPVDHMVGSIHCWRNMCALVKKKENSYF